MISVKVRGIEELQQFFRDLPRGTIRDGIRAATIYLIGDSNHGLRYYPARVTHGEGNPYQWQSKRQQRAFFATKGFGRGIPTVRTFELGRGWQYTTTNNGYQARIYNSAKAAEYVQGDSQQRGHAADKWRKTAEIISTNINGAIQAAERAVQKWIDAYLI